MTREGDKKPLIDEPNDAFSFAKLRDLRQGVHAQGTAFSELLTSHLGSETPRFSVSDEIEALWKLHEIGHFG